MSEEHCCGPTREQVNDACLRGEVLGTWSRCDACAKREAELLDRIEFIKPREPMPPWRPTRIVP